MGARILIIGDVVGKGGRRAVAGLLPGLRAERGLDLVVANGENLTGGFGLTQSAAEELFAAGVDLLTGGNHLWDRPDGLAYLRGEARILRPYNAPIGSPGQAYAVRQAGGVRLAVICLLGRLFMPPADSPFRALDDAVQRLAKDAEAVVVDFHAEATSEKAALAHYGDGRVAVVAGTHTHIPTADARLLPGGTAFITDIGMTGAYDSVIGMTKESAVARFLEPTPRRLEVASGDLRLYAVQVDLDARGRAEGIEAISRTWS